MSSIVLTGDTSGTITVSAPAVAGTRTLTLPAATGTMALTSDSPAALSTASGTAPSYSARAWVNFNGTGVVAIRASGNVSSITDNAVGQYTVNFTTAMPDVNYAWSGSAKADGAETQGGTVRMQDNIAYQAVGSCRIAVHGITYSLYDTDLINVFFIR